MAIDTKTIHFINIQKILKIGRLNDKFKNSPLITAWAH